jgi:septal ring factor EnvC (AmiA/AmiB activator)
MRSRGCGASWTRWRLARERTSLATISRVNDDLKRLADAAESLERQAGELRAEVERLAEAERQRAAAEAERAAVERDRAAAAPAPAEEVAAPPDDDSEARIVAFSMVLDGKPRDEVAQHLADEFGLADSDALLDDLYARAAG